MTATRSARPAGETTNASLHRQGVFRFSSAITRQSIDPALSSALVRAEAWKRRLIEGDGATLEMIADEERLNQSYASRMLRVAFLAPDLKQAVLDGTAPETLSLYAIMHRGLPLDWDAQRAMFPA